MNTIFDKFSLKAPPLTSKNKDLGTVSYSDLVRGVQKKEIKEVYLPSTSTGVAVFTDKDGNYGVSQIVQNQEFWKIMTDQTDATVNFIPVEEAGLDFMSIFWIVLLGSFIFRTLVGAQMSGPMMPNNFTVAQEVETRFTDVEGIDSAKGELEEIVDFLRHPETYADSGARVPRGALLTGPPGCGKTLLAKAIAGEADCPFIECSGSNFVEMFVGVGAKRIRDLFEIAKQNQPSIIFIDEIDAIGKKRGNGAFASNDEREQTINQLLVEMDGFASDTGVIVLAATNRPDTLDDALLRPGRFDRKIQVSLPGKDGRERILEVHSRDKKLSPDVDLSAWATCTTGFSGADLANLMNESAIRSVRDGKNGIIDTEIMEEVYQRAIIGAKGDTIFSQEKKDLVAYHESGHAIVGILYEDDYDELRKVSIIPRGDAGGVTFFSPREEGLLNTKTYYINQVRVLLGGRAAEEIIYGSGGITTGASQDLKQVNLLVREMVTGWSFTDKYFGVDYQDMSVLSARQVDREVNRIVQECYADVKALLDIHRVELEMLKQKLCEDEIVDGDWVRTLIKSKDTFCYIEKI